MALLRHISPDPSLTTLLLHALPGQLYGGASEAERTNESAVRMGEPRCLLPR